MEIIFSERFQKQFEKIKDETLLNSISSQVSKLAHYPEAGKPLRHNRKGCRSVRMPPFRIIYRIEGDLLIILDFDHRKDVY